MTQSPELTSLGWSAFFLSQLELTELSFTPARIAVVHRARLEVLTATGARDVAPGRDQPTGDFAVGDWVLLDGERLVRGLDRKSELARRAAGTGVARQLIAANVDTLFVVTSCNADFNPARLERYLALAAEAETEAVILLTKADLCDDPESYLHQASSLGRGVLALNIDARDPGVAETLSDWCKAGRTVALLGSSGVGKTTLMNTLTGLAAATQDIREDDAKGRHTTTNRALVPITGGGWLIDTPGMRELRLSDASDGIDEVFGDVVDLAATCKFNDCAHQGEPGCAVGAAIAAGELDPARLTRWQKLKREDRFNSETSAEARERSRGFGRKVKKVLALKDELNGRRR